MNYKVSIVIPNWNGKLLLEKNLPSVVVASKGAEIIIVDDGSTDDSVQFIKEKFPEIILIEKNKNEGFSSAVNIGVKRAAGEIVVLLNTDIEPEKNFLESLVTHFQDNIVFAVGCLDKSVEGDQIVQRGRGEASWQKGMYIHKKGEVDKTDTAWVSGGSGAFRKEYWDKLEGMDELFNPFYWEDIDLSYRARKAGYKTLFEPKSVVIHAHDEGVIKSSKKDYEITRVAYRNQFLCIWKNITDWSYIVEHLLFLHIRLIQSVVFLNKEFIFGYIDAIKLLPQIYMKRKKLQLMFIKSDKELLPRRFA